MLCHEIVASYSEVSWLVCTFRFFFDKVLRKAYYALYKFGEPAPPLLLLSFSLTLSLSLKMFLLLD